MQFDLISFKIDWLKSSFSKSKLAKWEEIFSDIINSRCPSHLATGIQKVLFIELTYCLLKHRKWSHLEIFEDIVSQFLHEEYYLDSHLAKKISQDMASKIAIDKTLLKKDKNEFSTHDFLLYLLVTVLSSSDSSWVLREVGLGSQILKKIKDLSDKFALEATQDIYYFSQDFDLQWLQAMENLSSKISNSAWAIDSLRFEFLLDEIDHYWNDFFKNFGYDVLFELFIAIELGQISTVAKLQEILEKSLELQSKEECFKNTESLIELLHKRDFIYKEYRDNQGNYKFKLTPLGQDITSRFYLVKYAKIKPSVESFMSLCTPWKKIILDNIFQDYAKIFIHVLVKKEPLDPTILEIGIRELKKTTPLEKIKEWLSPYVKNGATLEIKKTAEKITADMSS